jgi:hypothetical protein
MGCPNTPAMDYQQYIEVAMPSGTGTWPITTSIPGRSARRPAPRASWPRRPGPWQPWRPPQDKYRTERRTALDQLIAGMDILQVTVGSPGAIGECSFRTYPPTSEGLHEARAVAAGREGIDCRALAEHDWVAGDEAHCKKPAHWAARTRAGVTNASVRSTVRSSAAPRLRWRTSGSTCQRSSGGSRAGRAASRHPRSSSS